MQGLGCFVRHSGEPEPGHEWLDLSVRKVREAAVVETEDNMSNMKASIIEKVIIEGYVI